jgi:hypothetical protein
MKEKTPLGIIIVAITLATTIAVTPTLIQIQSAHASVISSTSRIFSEKVLMVAKLSEIQSY